jgi:protein ImuA
MQIQLTVKFQMPLSSTSLQRWPGVWRADELAPAAGGVISSGRAVLDAELPGGGWPLGAFIDLMAAAAHAPWLALLAPALSAHMRQNKGVLALVEPPHEPCLPALAAAGLPPELALWLHAKTLPERLWLAEQALGCAGVAVVLAWLPGAREADWRRLHLAAARRVDVLFFVLRPLKGTGAAACAPLGLAFDLAPGPRGIADRADSGLLQLRVDILKRRGPPLAAPLWLPAWNPKLSRLLVLEADRRTAAHTNATVLPFQPRTPLVPGGNDHALDRLALAV